MRVSRGWFALVTLWVMGGAGCQSSVAGAEEGANPPAGASIAEAPAQRAAIEVAEDPVAPPNAADIRYLLDPETGEVLTEVPPSLLLEAEEGLRATGHAAEAEQLAKLYDAKTGKAIDLEHAKKAQLSLRGGAR